MHNTFSFMEYHPFGTSSYRSGRTETEVSLKRYKYVGKERDEEPRSARRTQLKLIMNVRQTGLYYYGARYGVYPDEERIGTGWIARFVSVDPLQHKYPHYTPYQYAGNKPVSYIDLDGLEEAKPKEDQITPTGISYITPEGVELANIDSDERKIFVIHDSSIVNNILDSQKNEEKYDFSALTQDEAFEIPPYESRQQMKQEIDKAYTDTDMFGNQIADFEIGGFIVPFSEYSGLNKIGQGHFNRMRHEGNRVKDNFEQASLPQTINNDIDPFTIAENSGRDISLGAEKWTWHTHLNVFFDKVGNKRSYQWLERERITDSSIKIGADFFSGERLSKQSQQDMDNIRNNRIGIVIDMIGGVHLYNNTKSTKLKANIFFNLK